MDCIGISTYILGQGSMFLSKFGIAEDSILQIKAGGIESFAFDNSCQNIES